MFPSWWHVSRYRDSSCAKIETLGSRTVCREREREVAIVRADLCQLQCVLLIFLSLIAVTASIVFLHHPAIYK